MRCVLGAAGSGERKSAKLCGEGAVGRGCEGELWGDGEEGAVGGEGRGRGSWRSRRRANWS